MIEMSKEEDGHVLGGGMCVCVCVRVRINIPTRIHTTECSMLYIGPCVQGSATVEGLSLMPLLCTIL